MVKMLQMHTLRNNQEHCIIFILICIIKFLFVLIYVSIFIICNRFM